jgi:hypothetical protein
MLSCVAAVLAARQLGHMPQEDYGEALQEAMLGWLSGESDAWQSGRQMRMTKKGMVDA